MAKKTDKAVKDLKREVKKLRKQNEKLTETIGNMRENQAWTNGEILSALERLKARDDVSADPVEPTPEVTEAAERRAKDLNVDLSGVEEGSGSGGRVLVKDVEEAAEESL